MVLGPNKGKLKPNVTQVGPYAYRQIRWNEVLDINADNITYVQNYTYIFEPSLSCNNCSEDDVVTVPNIAAMTMYDEIYDKTGNKSSFIMNLAMTFGGPELFMKLKVREVIWGYDDPVVKWINNMCDTWFCGHIKTKMLKFFHDNGVDVPTSPRIALQHNGTEQAEWNGNLTMLTGSKDVNEIGNIVRWRGLDDAPYWLTKWGRMLNGTDGTKAPPFLKKSQKIYAFIPDICRSLPLTYEKEVSFWDINLYRFHITGDVYANATTDPDNIAFCSDNQTCWGTGMLPLSKCQPGGPPIFTSPPHFYLSDPKFAERVNGMNPDPLLHETNADIEPITGQAIRGHKRLQINIMARKFWLAKTQDLKYDINMLPILFIEENDGIGKETADEFKSMVLLPKKILLGAHYGLMGMSSFVALIALIITCLLISDFYKSNQYKEMICESTSESPACVRYLQPVT